MDSTKPDIDQRQDEGGCSEGEEAEWSWIAELRGRLSVEDCLEVTSKRRRRATAVGSGMSGFIIAGILTVVFPIGVAWVCDDSQ